jgi:hypothetical protein
MKPPRKTAIAEDAASDFDVQARPTMPAPRPQMEWDPSTVTCPELELPKDLPGAIKLIQDIDLKIERATTRQERRAFSLARDRASRHFHEMQQIPSSPVAVIPIQTVTPDQIAACRARLGLKND